MSVEAITWALGQPLKHSSAKFVLVALANCANTEWQCWPSVKYLCDATSQDRKTVLQNIKRLRDMGIIEDTGERRGATKQIAVYRLNSTNFGTALDAPEADYSPRVTRYYTYRLTDQETGEFYIGVRTCHCAPQEDRAYMGSGRWARSAVFHKRPLVKEVLAEWPDRETAEEEEMAAILSQVENERCMNIAYRTKNGPLSAKGTVPKTDGNSTENGQEQYRFSLETVPETVHGTVRNPKEPKKEPSLSGKKPDYMPQVREVLQFLRNMTGRNYREVPPTVKLITARLKNTPVADIKRMLAYKGDQWLNDPKMEPYLRPATLFAATNFEQYLAEALANEQN